MNELVVIVEGETEQTFVRDQLAAHLAIKEVSVWPVLPGRHRRHGGVKKWEVAKQDIIRTLKERRYCSTMFDYYALPDDWPGRVESRSLEWSQRASHVEDAIHEDLTSEMGSSFNPKYFIPYIQLHEFEALAFADVDTLASVAHPLTRIQSYESLIDRFRKIVVEAGNPEAINDSYETCPSRRIVNEVPAYKKRIYGPIVTKRIGLDVLRGACAHFASWLDRLETHVGKKTA
ncbi:MAG: DUF4276 family protein [Pirellulales bacterium]|nr:DUF4276 family protein [Pirellulales bacterium]